MSSNKPTRFALTLWAKPDLEVEAKYWTYMVGQEEIAPTTGTHHWQCYVETPKQRTIDTTIRHFNKQGIKVGYKVARGTAAHNKAYCTKEDTAVPNTIFEFGEPLPDRRQGHRSDLDELKEAVFDEGLDDLELLERFGTSHLKFLKQISYLRELRTSRYSKKLREITVEWVWGPPGTGKSYYASQHTPYDKPLLQHGRFWFENYRGEPTLILDDITIEEFSRTGFNHMLDVYPLQIPVKGSSTWACWTKVIITSNYPPQHIGDASLLRRIHKIIHLTVPFEFCGGAALS